VRGREREPHALARRGVRQRRRVERAGRRRVDECAEREAVLHRAVEVRDRHPARAAVLLHPREHRGLEAARAAGEERREHEVLRQIKHQRLYHVGLRALQQVLRCAVTFCALF